MLVELDVFSGRSNPQWRLDERSAEELRRLLGRLTSTALAAVEPPGLGYRGFVLTDKSGSWHAYHGYVRTSRDVLADSGFSIERFLLDRIPVEHALLGRRIASELGRANQ